MLSLNVDLKYPCLDSNLKVLTNGPKVVFFSEGNVANNETLVLFKHHQIPQDKTLQSHAAVNQAQPNYCLKSMDYRASLLLKEILKKFASTHHFQVLDELSSKATVSTNSTFHLQSVLPRIGLMVLF